MNEAYYEMIFKRKSFHLFRNIGDGKLTERELKEIEAQFNALIPLCPEIRVKMKIVKDVLSCNRGQEYCILMYSEKKDNYLQNIGYMGEQLDLYLVSRNIGTLWYGLGKVTEEKWDGLDFVIMIAIAKVDSENKFRKDMFKSKRKAAGEIWFGSAYPEIADIVRFAPSACNTQPWIVEAEKSSMHVYRYMEPGKHGIMPADRVPFYNQIDIGIFLCFLELCMEHCGIVFERTLYAEENERNERNLTASYRF